MSEVPPSKDVGPDPTVGAAEEDEEEEGGRAEKALGKLTSKFVSLLQQAPGGLLDLKSAAGLLAVPPKQRRIYDITNVLEGIGLISKTSKNVIRWQGGEGNISNAPDMSDETVSKLEKIRLELQELDKLDKKLDECDDVIKQSLEVLLDRNGPMAFLTERDVTTAYLEDRTIIAFQAPNGSKLVVPEPNPSLSDHRYSFSMTSNTGSSISAFLVHPDGDYTFHMREDEGLADLYDPTAEAVTGNSRSGAAAMEL